MVSNNYQKKCHTCKSRSHFSKDCRKKTVAKTFNEGPNRNANADGSGDNFHSFAFRVRMSSSNNDEHCDTVSKNILVDCGATSHIVSDVDKFINFDKSFDPTAHFIELADNSRSSGAVKARGEASVSICDNEGKEHNILLKNALLVPSYNQTIFSVQSATENGASVTFHPDCAQLQASDGTVFDINKEGKLYYLNAIKNIRSSTITTKSIDDWHRVLGHCNVGDILKLEKCVDGMKINNKGNAKTFQCDTCIKGKMVQYRERLPDKRAESVLELVHCDLAGPITPVAREGFKYTISFIDDYSGVIFVYFLRNKSDASGAFEKFIADSSPYGSIRRLRSDGGTEFTSNVFRNIAISNKIKQEFSCPQSPHQNGTAERGFRTLFEYARCILIDAKLPNFLWTYAVRYASYIRNRCYNARIGKTPVELFTSIRPNVNKLEVFGKKCFAYVQIKQKLDQRSREGIFVGFDTNSPAYLVYFPGTNGIQRIRCVVFNNYVGTPATLDKGECNVLYPPFTDLDEADSDSLPVKTSLLSPEKRSNIPNSGFPYLSVENSSLNILPSKDSPSQRIHCSSKENYSHESFPIASKENSSHESIPISSKENSSTTIPSFPMSSNENSEQRYPRRERHKPKRFEDYESEPDQFDDCYSKLVSCSVDYCYKISCIPATFEEATASEEAGDWKRAMDEEVSALQDNNTYTLTTLPPGRKCIGGRWVYNIKPGINNEPKYKARFVAKGYTQVADIDYGETFAPTARMTSIRMLLQVAVHHDMIIHQMDVKSAYLNSDIDRDLYVKQPKGYEKLSSNGDELVCKLQKSLYGLKQSSRNWNNTLNDYLLSQKFSRSYADPCLYTKFHDGLMIILLIWVDDILICTNSVDALNTFKTVLCQRFKMKDIGVMKWFLGIEVNFGENFVSISQSNFISKVLEKFNMLDAKVKSLPCDVDVNKFDCCDSKFLDNPKLYREIIGSLIYIMSCTRPDLSYVVTKLSQFMSKPTTAHLNYAKNVLRYLKGTKDQSIFFYKSSGHLNLTGFCDSDWGGSSDRKSISGFGFKLTENSALISWKSKKQNVVALSSCEAEYTALTHAVQEGKFLRQILSDMLNIDTQIFDLFVDNQGAIKLANNPVHRQRSKHIDIKYHFIRDEVTIGTLQLIYVPTHLNIADMFTKPVSRMKLDKLNFKGY